MTHLIPCQHLDVRTYNETVTSTVREILGFINQHQENHDGVICTAVIDDVLDQFLVFHIKSLVPQLGKEQTEYYLKNLLRKMEVHSRYALIRS